MSISFTFWQSVDLLGPCSKSLALLDEQSGLILDYTIKPRQFDYKFDCMILIGAFPKQAIVNF